MPKIKYLSIYYFLYKNKSLFQYLIIFNDPQYLLEVSIYVSSVELLTFVFQCIYLINQLNI